MSETKDTRFRPGQSGNPAGRKAGSGWVGRARLDLQRGWDGDMEDGTDGIRAKLISAAKAGEAWAVRLVAERVCPPIKASEAPVELGLTGKTLTEKADGVISALAAGDLSPTQAAQLLQALGALAKVVETDELARRVQALEADKK